MLSYIGTLRKPSRYFRVEYTLDPSLYPNRQISELLRFDRIYIDTTKSTANLQNVEVNIDDYGWLQANYIVNGIEFSEIIQTPLGPREVTVPSEKKLSVKWASTEDGKKIVFIMGREADIKITPPTNVTIAGDLVSLAKQDHVVFSETLTGLSANATYYSTPVDASYLLHNTYMVKSDQPIDVFVEESIDQASYFELEGYSIPNTSFVANKWNTIVFDKPSKYLRLRIVTGATAPTQVDIVFQGVR